jgi:hypothetical protein
MVALARFGRLHEEVGPVVEQLRRRFEHRLLRLVIRVQRDAELSDLLLVEDRKLGPVDLGPSAERGHDIVHGRFGLAVRGELGGDLLDYLLAQRPLELLISALASASWARRSALSARRLTISALESAAFGSGCRYQSRSDEELVAIALDQILDLRVARARLHRVAQALKRLFDRGLRQHDGRRHLAQGAPLCLRACALRDQLARHVVDRVAAVNRRLLAARRGWLLAASVGLCAGSHTGANPIGGLPARCLAGFDRTPLLGRAVPEHDLCLIDRGLGRAGSLSGLGVSYRFI